jgi:hypothetical protein
MGSICAKNLPRKISPSPVPMAIAITLIQVPLVFSKKFSMDLILA